MDGKQISVAGLIEKFGQSLFNEMIVEVFVSNFEKEEGLKLIKTMVDGNEKAFIEKATPALGQDIAGFAQVKAMIKAFGESILTGIEKRYDRE